MGYKNYTIRGKTDGFGCQYNAVLSGLAFCHNMNGRYRYVHTPFGRVSHGWEDRTDELNDFIGIPDGRHGKKIHVAQRFNKNVHLDTNPSNWYNHKVLDIIRKSYWSTEKPSPPKNDIVVHIRRGDVQPNRGGDRRARHMKNQWYQGRIPWLTSKYPSHYKVSIHSEGEMSEFQSIMNEWPQDLIDRTTWKLNCCLKTVFHEMVTAKILFQSKSGLSYTAGILSEGEVYFKIGSPARGQKYPLNNWILI
tara:strand:+ start:1251 stop:1997 length:747 start_codon:yes stop_codon:yes gene_type:complete